MLFEKHENYLVSMTEQCVIGQLLEATEHALVLGNASRIHIDPYNFGDVLQFGMLEEQKDYAEPLLIQRERLMCCTRWSFDLPTTSMWEEEDKNDVYPATDRNNCCFWMGLMQRKKKSPSKFFECGKKYFIRGVMDYYVGRVKEVGACHLVLEDASLVFETEMFSCGFITGKFKNSERFPNDILVNQACFIDATLWTHDLPGDDI